MEAINGTTIFWLIALGMVAGAAIKVIIWNRGVELVPNLIAGVIGAVIVGCISIAMQFPGSSVIAFLGSLAILFILNVFNLQPEADH